MLREFKLQLPKENSKCSNFNKILRAHQLLFEWNSTEMEIFPQKVIIRRKLHFFSPHREYSDWLYVAVWFCILPAEPKAFVWKDTYFSQAWQENRNKGSTPKFALPWTWGSVPLLWLAEKGSSRKICGAEVHNSNDLFYPSNIFHSAPLTALCRAQARAAASTGTPQHKPKTESPKPSQPLQATQPAQEHTDHLKL